MHNNGKHSPKHSALKYDECFAKIVLEIFFYNAYGELSFSDKPDLRSEAGNIGIEATTIMPSKMREALGLYDNISRAEGKEREKMLSRLKKNGFQLTEYGLMQRENEFSYSWDSAGLPPLEITPFMNFLNAFSKKVEKLNSGGYAEMSRYDLFVQSELFPCKGLMPIVLKRLKSANNGLKRYAKVYLLTLKSLEVFDLTNDEYISLSLGTRLYGVGERANDMVLESEGTKQIK